MRMGLSEPGQAVNVHLAGAEQKSFDPGRTTLLALFNLTWSLNDDFPRGGNFEAKSTAAEITRLSLKVWLQAFARNRTRFTGLGEKVLF